MISISIEVLFTEVRISNKKSRSILFSFKQKIRIDQRKKKKSRLKYKNA